MRVDNRGSMGVFTLAALPLSRVVIVTYIVATVVTTSLAFSRVRVLSMRMSIVFRFDVGFSFSFVLIYFLREKVVANKIMLEI
jgi:hypothetical protein